MSSAFSRLAAAVSAQRQPAAIERFLLELLTPGEAHDLALRWELVELLVGGVSQRQIASRLGISLCKITRGAKILKKRNGAVAASFGKAPARKGASAPVKKGAPAAAKTPVRKAASAARKPAQGSPAPAAKPVRTKTEKKVVGRNGTRIPGKSKNQVRR